ncbi:hypothetical protein GCM10027174_44750 [Salinifilum aidingensis]
MRVTVSELNQNISGVLHQAAKSGEPTDVVNGKRRGRPTEAVLVSAELWEEILRVPSVRKRIKEHVAAKQAANEDSLSQAA